MKHEEASFLSCDVLILDMAQNFHFAFTQKKKSRPSKVSTPVPSAAKPEESSTTEATNRINSSSRDQLEATEEVEEEEGSPGPRGDEASPGGDEPEQLAKPSLPQEEETTSTITAPAPSNVTVSSKGDLESREEVSEDDNKGGEGEEESDLVDSDDENEEADNDDDDDDVPESGSAVDGDENSQSPENVSLVCQLRILGHFRC